jgi:hypothetical protein
VLLQPAPCQDGISMKEKFAKVKPWWRPTWVAADVRRRSFWRNPCSFVGGYSVTALHRSQFPFNESVVESG